MDISRVPIYPITHVPSHLTMNIQQNIPLAQFTNWRIGGPADYFAEVTTRQDMEEALAFATEKKIPFFVLGGGTNVLVSDNGVRGLVIRNKMNDIRLVAYKGKLDRDTDSSRKHVYVTADAGVLTNRLVRYTLDQGLSGLENFLGQPGSLGGAVYINAHNMNQNDFIGDHMVEAELLSPDGKIRTEPQSYFNFGYDVSTLQDSPEVVLSVTFQLINKADEKDAIWEKAEAAMKYRHNTQPKGHPTAGCTFRNVSDEDAKKANLPSGIKSAGFMIDACGLKGTQIGNAKISDEHANFILNMGSATSDDVKQLIDLSKKKIAEKFGINVHEEVVLVGEFE